MRQYSFEDVTYDSRKKKTRKQRFLDKMEEVLPWEEFFSLMEPLYLKDTLI